MHTVTIKNNTARSIAIVLDHPAFRKRQYGFRLITEPHIIERRDGTRSQRMVRRAIPGSITLLAHATLSGLHGAICGCQQVRVLAKQGRITVRDETVGQPPPRKKPTRTRRSRVVVEPKVEQQTEDIKETTE